MFSLKGEDFVIRDNLAGLVEGMNALSGDNFLDHDTLRAQIEARDREVANAYTKDAQVAAIHNARRYIGDRIFRVVKPHRILDPRQGPLIAVRLSILTRKTLGGLHTNVDGQVLDAAGEPIPGLYAAGEVAGGRGGGYHGYNALEGTFLGSCIFFGRIAGRHAAGRSKPGCTSRIGIRPVRRKRMWPTKAARQTLDARSTAHAEAGRVTLESLWEAWKAAPTILG